MTRPYLLTLVLAMAPLGCSSRVGAGSLQTCTPLIVSVDTTGADFEAVVFSGRGWGEVIQCSDSIVASITYWQRPQQQSLMYDAQLYVTPVDSTGWPQQQVLYSSAILVGTNADPFHPNPIVFTFNPPLTLPHVGKYFFDVKAAYCPSNFQLMADTTDRYPDGRAWESGAACDPGTIGGPSSYIAAMDMIFDITFCDTHSTPVLSRTWGELKMRYR